MEGGLAPGLRERVTWTVRPEHSAEAYGNVGVPVLATPALLALAEWCCGMLSHPRLPRGQVTVGRYVELHHLAAVPVGGRVVAEAVLTEVDGRRLVFDVEVRDEAGREVGRVRHERVVVDLERFLTRVAGG